MLLKMKSMVAIVPQPRMHNMTLGPKMWWSRVKKTIEMIEAKSRI